ncbi:beta-galactosidase [Bacteroides caccae]|uniref:beta-galactosidase n=2 Tax=Bacteroides caccae TaxID=47678 RepID=UPI0035BBB410
MVIVICFYNECIGVKIIKHLFNRQNFIFIVRSGPYVCAEWEMGGLYFRIRWQTCQPWIMESDIC